MIIGLLQLCNNSENSCLLCMQTSEHQKPDFFPLQTKPNRVYMQIAQLIMTLSAVCSKVEMGGQGR